jgi:hypothetical protein
MEKQVVTNTQNNVLYLSYGDGRFQNLSTGVSGQIDEKLSAKIFVPNAEATYFWNECKEFEELIRRLNLKIDK